MAQTPKQDLCLFFGKNLKLVVAEGLEPPAFSV